VEFNYGEKEKFSRVGERYNSERERERERELKIDVSV
jgi:hypothetical protein